MVTKQDCINARHGDHFRYLGGTYSKSKELKQVRVSGKCQTWKSRPEDFRLPVKYGMYESLAITPDNAAMFITEAEYQLRKPQAQAVGQVLKNPRIPSIDETEIHTWFERDRSHVELRDKRTDRTIVEWWDEAVHEAVEDGFLDPRDWHHSAYDYAMQLGMLVPKRKRTMRRNPRVLRYDATGEPVRVGDKAKTFRGKRVTVTGMREPHKPSSTGRVYVKEGAHEAQYFPSVIGASWKDNPGKVLHPTRIGAAHDAMSVTISPRKNEHGEYVVRLYRNHKHYKPADYFTDDMDDAQATARAMYERESSMIGKAGFFSDSAGALAKMRKNPDTITKWMQANGATDRIPTARQIRASEQMMRKAAASRVTRKRALPRVPGSGKHIYVQQKRGEMWFTLAVAPNNEKGYTLARNWAIRYHRRHPNTNLRIER